MEQYVSASTAVPPLAKLQASKASQKLKRVINRELQLITKKQIVLHADADIRVTTNRFSH